MKKKLLYCAFALVALTGCTDSSISVPSSTCTTSTEKSIPLKSYVKYWTFESFSAFIENDFVLTNNEKFYAMACDQSKLAPAINPDLSAACYYLRFNPTNKENVYENPYIECRQILSDDDLKRKDPILFDGPYYNCTFKALFYPSSKTDKSDVSFSFENSGDDTSVFRHKRTVKSKDEKTIAEVFYSFLNTDIDEEKTIKGYFLDQLVYLG